MHDTLIQGCVGVSTLLEAASHAKDVSPELGHDLVDRARAEVRAAVDEARLAVWNLRHGSSNGDRLVPAVSQLAHRVGLDAGIDIEVDVSGTPVAVGGETERSLMLLIREALQNAIRHAGSQPSVDLAALRSRKSSTCRSRTTAWGSTRHSINRNESQHYGLVGMRERVEHLGGEFEHHERARRGHAACACGFRSENRRAGNQNSRKAFTLLMTGAKSMIPQ